MAIDLKQSLKTAQQLLMTPQLQQAIKLLQLSRLELEQFVRQELIENPVLEEVGNSASEDVLDKVKEPTEDQILNNQMKELENIMSSSNNRAADNIDWESYSQRSDNSGSILSSFVRKDEEFINYEAIITKAKTLQEYLLMQIAELGFDDKEKHVAEILIGNLDENGYLRGVLEDIAKQENLDLEFCEDILDTIQRLDPPGVGARNLQECLMIQIRNKRLKNGIVEKIVKKHLNNLEKQNYQAISKDLKIPIETVIENIHIILSLDPNPGRQFNIEVPQYIVPDVYVFKLGDKWVISLNEDGLPKLKINEQYKQLTKNKDALKSSDKEYLSEKLKAATWLIKSLQQRQKTIYKVSECIVKRQQEFFQKGVEFLKPMILKDVADDIGLHESTVSRVTTQKYMHTPHGIFELKYFFSTSVATLNGAYIASESVKKMIEDIIRSEDPVKPYSDNEIVEILEKKGIHIARRTVGKYREQLGILSSNRRKKIAYIK